MLREIDLGSLLNIELVNIHDEGRDALHIVQSFTL